MVTRQDVEAAYLLILGRAAELGAADHWIGSTENTLDLLKGLLASDEFRANRLPQLLQSGLSLSPITPKEVFSPNSEGNELMHAAIHGGIRQIELVEMERPVATPGTIVIQIGAVGICGSDLSVYRSVGHRINAPRGHEYSGVVVEVGKGVEGIQLGQRVTVDIFLESACGKCAFCRRGAPLHCKKRNRLVEGGFAEFVRVDASAAFPLPDNVDESLGALTEPLAVAVHAVRKLNISRGMSGVVVGAGTIGLMAVAAALDAGAERVYVVARHPFQAEASLALGASAVLPANHQEAVEKVFAETEYGVDFAIEAVGGRSSTLNEACEYVRPLGAVGVIGAFESEFNGCQPFIPLVRELRIEFSNCYGYLDGRHDFDIALDLLSRKGDVLRKLITHEFPLKDISEAFRVADNKEHNSIKVQVRP